MVRTYNRKSQRAKNYTKEDLTNAVEQVKGGRVAYQVSKAYNIPLNTLLDHVKGRRGQKSSSFGRPSALPVDVESKLAANLATKEKHGFGLSRKEVIDLVADYVKQNNLKTPFKQGIPGKDWLLSFMKRHNLSVKKPENVEVARRKSRDPFIINNYFELVNKTLSNLNIKDKPHLIWNMDETSFCSDPSKTKIVGKKGAKATRTTSTSGRENTSVLLACNANGDKAPPLIIFKGKQIWTHMMPPEGKGFPGTTYAATPNGWMQSDVFENYFQNSFLKTIGNERPVMLIYDGHTTHIGIKVIQMAIDAGVTIIKLPPHSSHILQPLDLSVMKSVKNKWDPALVYWQRKHIGQKLPKSEFSIILGQIWSETPREVITNGFRKAGLFPFNNKIIPEESFDLDALARWKAHNCQDVTSQPGTSTTAQEFDDRQPGSQKNSVLSEIENVEQSPSSVSLFDKLMLDRIKRGNAEKQKRNKICEGAEIITAEEVLERIKKQIEEKKKKPKSGKKTVSRKVQRKRKIEEVETSEEDEIESIRYSTSEDEDLLTMVEREEQDIEEENDIGKAARKGDWVIVRFSTKKTKKYFIGEIRDFNGEPQVRFVKTVSKNKFRTTCIFPEIEDISEVSQEDIVSVLPQPQIGRRGELHFSVSFTNYNLQ